MIKKSNKILIIILILTIFILGTLMMACAALPYDGDGVPINTDNNDISYYVTYHPNNNIDDDYKDVDHPYSVGDHITIPYIVQNIKNDPYILVGWDKEKGESGTRWIINNDLMPSHDLDLYAEWGNKITYQVKFDYNDGVTVSITKDIDAGSTIKNIKPNDPTRIGFTFLGWFYNDKGQDIKWDDNAKVTSNLILTAKWKGISHQVSFDLNGGYLKDPNGSLSSIILPQNKIIGEKIEDPVKKENYSMIKDGYVFNGWFNEKNNNNLPWDFENDTMGASNITLTAHWNLNNYNIIYHLLNDDSQNKTSKDKFYYNSTTTEDNEVRKTISDTNFNPGKSFVNWYTDNTYSTIWIFGPNGNKMPSYDLNLYAKWEIATYHVKCDFNGGYEGNSSAKYKIVDVKYNDAISLPSLKRKNNANFSNWYYKNDNQTWEVWSTTRKMNITHDIILVAHWDKYDVTFSEGNTNGQTVSNMPSSTTYAPGQTVLRPSETPKTNGGNPVITFNYWGYGVEDSSGIIPVWNFNNIMPEHDVELIAVWCNADVTKYTITYDVNCEDVDAIPSVQYSFGQHIYAPTDPVRKVYKNINFMGWFDGDTKFVFGTMPDKNIKLTAHWDKYILTFDKNKPAGIINDSDINNMPTEQLKNAGDIIGIPYTNPTCSGYTFSYWAKDKEGLIHLNTADKMGENNVKLYVIWKDPINDIQVTFNFNGGVEIYNNNTEETISCTLGKTITKPNYQLTYVDPGNNILSWYDNNETDWDFNNSVVYYNSSKHIYLYARWIKYRVSYSTENPEEVNGMPTNYSPEMRDGEYLNEPVFPTRYGYIFDGWYLNNGIKWDFKNTVHYDMSLMAKWIKVNNSCRVSFNLNYGKDMGKYYKDQIIPVGFKILFPKVLPYRPGYIFLHWDYNGTTWTYDNIVTSQMGNNIVLKAIWQKGMSNSVLVVYRVLCERNNSWITYEKHNQALGSYIDVTLIYPPKRHGYIYKGWYIDSNCTILADLTTMAYGKNQDDHGNASFELYTEFVPSSDSNLLEVKYDNNSKIFNQNGFIGDETHTYNQSNNKFYKGTYIYNPHYGYRNGNLVTWMNYGEAWNYNEDVIQTNMVLTEGGVLNSSYDTNNQCNYIIIENNYVIITKFDDGITSINVPATINTNGYEYPVYDFGIASYEGTYDSYSRQNKVLPCSANNKITNINFSSAYNLFVINDNAFAQCTSLQSVTFPSLDYIVGSYGFYWTTYFNSVKNVGLENINHSNTCVVIGYCGFYNSSINYLPWDSSHQHFVSLDFFACAYCLHLLNGTLPDLTFCTYAGGYILAQSGYYHYQAAAGTKSTYCLYGYYSNNWYVNDIPNNVDEND